jgi:hypothetical protein
MQHQMEAFYNKLIPTAASAASDIEDLKAQAQELKDYAKAYAGAQFALQVISTAALVGVFLLTLKAAQKRGK